MVRDQGDLSRRSHGNVIHGSVIGDVDKRQRAALAFDLTWVNEYAAGLDLALRDRTDNRARFAFEYSPRHNIERDLRIVSRYDALQRILLKCRR